MMNRLAILFLLAAGCALPALPESALAEVKTPIVLDDSASYKLKGRAEILEDKTGTLPLEQVRRSTSFQAIRSETPGFGFSRSTFWYRLRVVNKNRETLQELYFTLMESNVNALTFFEFNKDKLIRKKETGSLKKYGARDIPHRHFVFRIDVPPAGERELYLRVQNQEAVNFAASLKTSNNFIRSNYNRLLILGIYYGIILVMLLYNLILYVSVQDRNYFFYILYIASFLLFQLIMNGFAFEYLWPDSPYWNSYSTKTLAGLTGVFALIFTRNFLNVSDYSKILDYVLMAMIGVAVLLAVSPFLLSIRAAAIFSNLFGLGMVLTVITVGVYVLLQGYHPARFFLIAWSALLLGIVLMTLMFLGVLPANWLTKNSLQIGSAVEMVLLSLGLRDRIRTMRRSREQAEKELVHTKLRMLDSFARFVPRQFLEFLKKESIEDVAPGDAVREEITVLFNDLRNFTTISESLSAEDNFRFINEYLEHMEPVIKAHNGFIDKFIGDAIMALFPGPPADALKAARGMRGALAEFNKKRESRGLPPVAMGIGLNRGPLMLGTVGTADRMDTTVIGDTVNLAARLEGLTRTYGVTILVSDGIARAASADRNEFHIREIDLVRVKGKTQPAVIHEVFDGDTPDSVRAKETSRPQLARGLECYRRGDFQASLEEFRTCRERYAADSVAALYIRRCEYYIKNPPVKWAGITGRTLPK